MNRLKDLLSKGLEITGTFENVLKVLTEVEDFDGIKSFTESDVVTAKINIDDFKPQWVMNLKGLYFLTKKEFAVVVDRNKIMLDNGNVMSAKEFFGLDYKVDKRKSGVKVGDMVKLRYYSNDDSIFAINGVFPREVPVDIGFVKDIKDGIAFVVIGKTTYKLPTICCVPTKIFDKSFQSIVSFMSANKANPVIDGSMMYLSVTDDGGMIEYVTSDRVARFEGDFWDADKRRRFATRKRIRKVLIPMFKGCSDSLIEDAIIISGKTDLVVEILKGKDILEVFVEDKCSNKGSISSSCMRDKPVEWFELYTDNAECAIIRGEDGKIVLRSLSWNLTHKKTGKKIKFLDRLYSSSTALETLFKSWAMSNKYHMLSHQSYNETNITSPNGKSDTISDYYGTLKKAHYENFPFLDTMRYVAGKTIMGNYGVRDCQSTSGRSDNV